MRRKLISYLMICVLVFMPVNSYADLATAIKYVTFDEKEWKQAQQDMLKYYNIANALPKEKGGGKLPMNMYLKRSNGTTKEQNSYYFAYGDPEEGKYYTTLGLHKSLGKVCGGNERLFNPPYGWEFSWNWKKLEEWGQVKQPWKNGLCDRHKFDGKELPASSGMKDLEECIQRGLDITYGNMPYDIIKASRDPEEAEKIIDKMEKGEKFSNIVFTKGAKPKAGGKWIDYVHITMLPTTKVWGQGYMYLKDGTAMPVPIAPFNALQPDLVPSISSPFQSTGAYNTDVVSADVVVRSSFESDETVDYQWLIKGEKTGKVYQSSEESQCVFGGYGTAEKGDAKIVGRMTSNDKIFSTFSVNFVMPDESVRVIFILNSKNNPKEDQSNNKVEVLIKGLHYEVQEATYTLDYNELSKEIEHPLAGGGVSGVLRSPTIEDWYWVDEYHMTGSLPIAIAASIGGRTALQDADVKAKTNEPVDEIGTSVVERHIILATNDILFVTCSRI